jgi:hypothetical protein
MTKRIVQPAGIPLLRLSTIPETTIQPTLLVSWTLKTAKGNVEKVAQVDGRTATMTMTSLVELNSSSLEGCCRRVVGTRLNVERSA